MIDDVKQAVPQYALAEAAFWQGVTDAAGHVGVGEAAEIGAPCRFFLIPALLYRLDGGEVVGFHFLQLPDACVKRDAPTPLGIQRVDEGGAQAREAVRRGRDELLWRDERTFRQNEAIRPVVVLLQGVDVGKLHG